jgi:hypothetical protein
VIAAFTDATREAQQLLRDPSHFQWATVVLLGFVLYVYSVEIERRRWDVVLAGVAFWLMDGFNELANSAILHASGTSALWTVTGSTSYLILIGYTIEISFLFAVSGIAFVKQLPADPRAKVLGVNNRLLFVFLSSVACVAIEVLLHDMGVFHWHYWWWNWPFVPLIVVFGYMTFFGIAAWVFDMGDDRRRQLTVVGTLAAIDAAGVLVLGLVGWL